MTAGLIRGLTTSPLRALRTLRLITLLLLMGLLLSGCAQEEQAADPLPLAQDGPQAVGMTTRTFIDTDRNDRSVYTIIWYPAQDTAADAAPDLSGAPYPLVILSHGHSYDPAYWGDEASGNRAGHLASLGYVVAAPAHNDPGMWQGLADRPLDILFVLDQLAGDGAGDLAGMINTDRVGVWGVSLGGTTTLALSGARIDPPALAAWCQERDIPDDHHKPCYIRQHWAELAELVAPFGLSMDESWTPFGDDRIQAVIATMPWGGPVFGEAGLAAATVPTLIIGGTEDNIADYDRDAAFIFTHLGSEDKTMVSLIEQNHGGMDEEALRPMVSHFATAFLGRTLKEQDSYADYLTEAYVEQFEELAWEVYDD